MVDSVGRARPTNAIRRPPVSQDETLGSGESNTHAENPPRRSCTSSTRVVAVAACASVVLLVYVRFAWSYGKQLDPAPNRSDFHNLIADAFVNRQTALTIKPPKGLLELKNPYDPRANVAFRGQGLHDLSLYKGKLYAYFGPAPALLLFIPFRALRLGDLSPPLAALAFCAFGFAFSILLFRTLARRFFGDLPLWMTCFAVLALGLAIPGPFIIYIGRAYEVSIACGYFLLFAGLYCLVSGLLSETKARFVLLALGSTALGAAVAARPDLVVGVLFIAVAGFIVLRRARDESHRDRLGQIVAMVLPYVTIGILLAIYNFVRFDSITEFGQKYQLAGADSTKYAFYQLWYIPHGLYYYLLAPARFSRVYPYAYLLKNVPYVDSNDVYVHEPVAGVLTNMPLIGFGLALTATQIRRLSRDCPLALLTILSLLFASVAIVTGAAFTLRGATMRYALDFAPLMLVGVLLTWTFWSLKLTERGFRFWLLQSPWLVLLTASILFNLALGLTPCQGTGSC